jgi:hypothetical protein
MTSGIAVDKIQIELVRSNQALTGFTVDEMSYQLNKPPIY